MATATAKIKEIRLNYNFSKRTIKTVPRIVRLKKGEAIEFISKQGTLHVLLTPASAYQPAEFRTGDAPVIVKRVVKGMFWCGGTFRTGSKTITINPADKQYGSTPNPPPDPGGDGGS
jgi:hypothetical protein